MQGQIDRGDFHFYLPLSILLDRNSHVYYDGLGVWLLLQTYYIYASVAQLVEQLIRNQ